MYITVAGFAIIVPIQSFELLYGSCCEYPFCQFVNLGCNVRYLLFQENTVLHIGHDKLRDSLYNYSGADFLNCSIFNAHEQYL